MCLFSLEMLRELLFWVCISTGIEHMLAAAQPACASMCLIPVEMHTQNSSSDSESHCLALCLAKISLGVPVVWEHEPECALTVV